MVLLNVVGLSVSIIGSIILAVSLNKFLKMIDSSILALELFRETFLSNGNVVQITGMEKHRNHTKTKAARNTLIGLVLIILGFVCQLLSMFVAF